jgi:hypothetical protein
VPVPPEELPRPLPTETAGGPGRARGSLRADPVPWPPPRRRPRPGRPDGRGGAEFPAGQKLRNVLNRSRKVPGGRGGAVVVANGAESEPISMKDRALLTVAPHLVLDGISLAAESVARWRHSSAWTTETMRFRRRLGDAVAERQRAGADPVPIRIAAVPPGYVSSEESAFIHLLNGGPALPTFVPPRPFQKGERGRPTLVPGSGNPGNGWPNNGSRAAGNRARRQPGPPGAASATPGARSGAPRRERDELTHRIRANPIACEAHGSALNSSPR